MKRTLIVVFGGTLLACLGLINLQPPTSATPQEPAETFDDPIEAPTNSIALTELRWTSEEGLQSLTVCSNSSLNDTGEGNSTIQLTCSEDGIPISDPITGDLEDGGKCAVFNGNISLPATLTSYTLIITLANGSISKGSVSIEMTVKTSLLSCNESLYTKISWTTPTQLLNTTCIASSETLTDVCYFEGDLSNTNFCFTVQDNTTSPATEDIIVCLEGPTNNNSSYITEDNSFSVGFLQYGDGQDIDPSFAMSSNGSVTAVIVSKDDGQPTVYVCNNDKCPIPGLVPAVTQYRVCGEIVDSGDTLQTATTDFKDLDLHILMEESQNRDSLLQFVFANALPEKVYRAVLSSVPPNGTNDSDTSDVVDCTLVQPNHGCFGYLDAEGKSGTVYLMVSGEEEETNTVVAPYDTGVTEATTTVGPLKGGYAEPFWQW